jgi:uncharacterized protein (TIGR02231 family)
VNEVIILLAAGEDTNVEFMLSYVVMDAAWHAAYDVRVESGKSQLDLTYYGFICNNSLEDWSNASLSLSTAKPSVGGAPPELTTKFVGIRQPWIDSSFHSSPSYVNRAVYQNEVAACSAFPEMEHSKRDRSSSSRDEQMQVMTSSVTESSICASFNIPRKTTILSDNKPHKVTIRIIPLEAKFTYVIIPKLSLHAYLKAHIMNTNESYPLLPGEINVFMDGNFITKSTIKAVSPQESFGLFLGTDDSIKVTYPPGVHYRESKGLLSKSNLKTMKHAITIKNTKSEKITVTVFDQLPKSNDSQIKVKLLKPTIQEGDHEVSLTQANNLKWKKDIASGKQIQIPFEFQVEWPQGIDVTDF